MVWRTSHFLLECPGWTGAISAEMIALASLGMTDEDGSSFEAFNV